MSETQRILALSHRARTRGEQLCLATVVHVEGSAYRKPGARMLVTSGGERAGTISGGCLEAEVSRKAWWLTANGARLERYSSFADEDGGMPYGLGCGGTVSLLLEQGAPAQAVLAALDRVLSTRQPAIVITALGRPSSAPEPFPPDPRPSHAGTVAVLAPHTPQASGLHSTAPATLNPELSNSPYLEINRGPGAWEILYLRPESHLIQSPVGHGTNGTNGINGTNGTNGTNGIHETARINASKANNAKQPSSTLHPALATAAHDALTQRLSCLLTSRFLPCPATWQQPAHAADAPAYFVEYLAPPPAVTIFGAGDDAQPIAELAHTLGWRITIADGRSHLARRDRFPQAAEVRVLNYADPSLRAACGIPPDPASPSPASSATPASTTTTHPLSPTDALSAPLRAALPLDALLPNTLPPNALLSDDLAIILTHSYEQDRALLAALLPRNLRYLGILGPRHRTQRLLTEVTPTLGLSIEEAFARLHSPIGLDLGAGDPATVALSIVAQIQAVLQGRQVHITRSSEPLALLLAGD